MSTRAIGWILGPLAAVALQLVPVPDGLSREGWLVASLGIWMAIWWATEAVPLAVTALLPLVVLPLGGVLTTAEAGRGYASPIVLLLLGGFMIALALEKSNLHARIALNIVARAGGRPRMLILGFMIAAAALSMWISNTATTLMMIPIALSVAAAEAEEGGMPPAFATALVLGVAYAASIGGVATPVGTPTNLIAIQYLEDNTDLVMSFPQWMALGLPVVALMIPLSWFVLTRFALRVPASAGGSGAHAVREHLAALGGLTEPEKRVAIVFGLVALCWVVRLPVINALGIEHLQAINGSQADATIAIAGAILMFALPSGAKDKPGDRLMDWDTTKRLPWGIVLLFGGGLSLAAAMRATGLATWIGGELAFAAVWPPLLIALLLVAVIIFLTELTSNVATVTAFLPVIGAVAIEGGIDPIVLAAPAAIAGSFAFMLPVATAPNAIVYASGAVSIGQMMRTGLWLNVLGIALVTVVAGTLAGVVFG